MNDKIQKLPLDQVEVKDHRHRMSLDIDSLVESMETIGQINPITVKKVGDRYRIIAGRRRFASLRRIEKETGKPQVVLAVVKDLDDLHEELIFIDENLMRQELSEVEYDEALYRRKQLYEQLHPETKQHAAGGHAKSAKDAPKEKRPLAFAADSAKKLNVSKRTVEKAIARAARASDSVKKAREKGDLTPSQVDLLVSLEPKDQEILLPVVKEQDLSETRELMERVKRHGAKAAVLYLEEESKEDPALKPVIREAQKLLDMLTESAKEERLLRGQSRYENLRMLEELHKRLDKFLALQKSEMGYIRAVKRLPGGDRKVIRQARA